jgi:predicted nucleotidyltransferase
MDSEAEIRRRTRLLWDDTPAVLVAYLFGSLARGRPTPLSDVDVAILVDADREPDLAALTGALSDRLGTDAMDLVVLNHVGPTLAHRVLRDGRILFCRNEPARLEFTRRRLLEYFDTAPLRAAARRSVSLWTARELARG